MTRLISLIVALDSPLCVGTQAFGFQLVNSKLIPVGLARILLQDHSGKLSCRNSTVDMPLSQTRAFRSKHYPFWLNFRYVVPEIKYIPKLVELLRYNDYGKIMSYVS